MYKLLGVLLSTLLLIFLSTKASAELAYIDPAKVDPAVKTIID